MSPFECTRHFGYRDVKPDMNVSFPALLGAVLEASLLHTESTPYPMAWFTENKAGFILTGWQARVVTQPRWGDEITVRTWPCRFKGVVAERTFQAFGQDGGLVLQANSGWAFMDLARKRPVRPSAEIVAGYGAVAPPAIPVDFALPDTSAFQLVRARWFTVSRRDIDTNGHANNIAYIEWAMEDIPDDVYAASHVVEMKVQYRKECVRGDALLAETLADPRDKNAFAVRIKNSGQMGAPLCEVFFRFG